MDASLPSETRRGGRTRVKNEKARGDNVKDESGSYAVFTEKGSSASQVTAASGPHLTAAKVLDTISQLPSMSSEASDAVSAHTQIKMTDTPTLLKLSKTEASTEQSPKTSG